MPTLHIRHLSSGGIITNYYCTSRCGHCLYGSSPGWDKGYIDAETFTRNLETIKGLGCHSVHIGGGEPFLNLKGLEAVLRAAHELGMGVEYVETNSSWFKDRSSACTALTTLRRWGLSTLLISMSPFHNEHIPFSRVKGVIEACQVCGIGVFPWIADFYQEIDAFDDSVPHRMEEYRRRFGDDYLMRLPARYWIHPGGRALATYADVLARIPLEEILESHPGGCNELLDVTHFHLDLFGNYIPGLCSGMAIQREDLGSPLSPDEYPLLTTLFQSGIKGLLDRASAEFGFRPETNYTPKCHLCFDIRRYLVRDSQLDSKELQPQQYYEESLGLPRKNR
jgi:hypothetical protein